MMKKLLLLSAFLCLGVAQVDAQKKAKKPKKGTTTIIATNDPVESLNHKMIFGDVQRVQEEVEATLQESDRTQKNPEGQIRHYDTYKIYMHTGEELFLEHTSNEFRVMLALKKPESTTQTDFSYDSQNFTGSSRNKFYFVAPTTGVYTLLATSMDSEKSGAYKIVKTLYAPGAVEAELEPEFAKQFRNLLGHKKKAFKEITGEKIKKDKNDKTNGLERFNSNFELVTGKTGTVVLENSGQTANFKSVLLETDNPEEAKTFFEKMKKQLQILTRAWSEQLPSENIFSASTEKEIVSLNLVNEEFKKKKEVKQIYKVQFTCN
jgi:hypothetical protein